MEGISQGADLNVLMVEDSDDDAVLLAAYLEEKGFAIKWYRVDTESALEAALRHRCWDVVLSDYTMPRYNGAAALKLIQHQAPDLPVIMVSGTLGEDAAVNAMQAGAQDYVIKSKLARLVPAIHKALLDASEHRKRLEAEQRVRILSQVVEQATDSVFITDQKGAIEYVNPAYEKITGYRAADVIGHTLTALKFGQHDRVQAEDLWETVLRRRGFHDILRNRRKSGEVFFEETLITPLIDKAGTITHFVATGRDVTERVNAEQTRSRLQSIIEVTTDIVAVSNADGDIVYLNQAGRKLFGSPQLRLTDTGADELTEEQTIQVAQTLIGGEACADVGRKDVYEREIAFPTKEGGAISLSQLVLTHRTEDGAIAYISTVARDITERKWLEAELRHQATHDTLTGLANRALLSDQLAREIHHHRRRGRYLAMVFIDLNNFKRVNDSLGHGAGDQLLKAVANRLRDHLRPTDILARYGGDEFVVVVTDLEKRDRLLNVLQTLHRAFTKPFSIANRDLFVTFSSGIAFWPDDGLSGAALLRNADAAMFQAKAGAGQEYRFYAPSMNAQRQGLLALETELHWALKRREFLLHYQPQVDVSTGKVVGMEALLRWQHPQRGLVHPLDFIPLLEETGLIIPVGLWVLRQACIDVRGLWALSGSHPRLSVNISPRQFSDGTLLTQIRTILAEEQFPAEALELEITEQTLMNDLESSGDILLGLQALGVRVAIDDFGTGYCSLAYLKRFPINVLKIDRAFIKDLPGDFNGAAITEAINALGQKLGLSVVAEGVETQEQLTFLRQRDCNLVQGYIYSRPVGLELLGQLVQMRLGIGGESCENE